MSATAPSEPVVAVLNKLERVRRAGAGWMARCPAHEDHNPSLSVDVGTDGRCLLKCHAGCSTEAILAAVELNIGDLFSERPSPPPARSRGRASAPSTRYEIKRANGEIAAVHVRTDHPDGKRMSWERADGTSGLNGTPAASLPLYGSEHAASWDVTRPVLLVEGEKAADALIGAGFQAVGSVTGASSAPDDGALGVLAGCEVVAWPDNDEPGRQHMVRILERASVAAASVRTIEWPDAPAGGDAFDALAAGGQPLVEQLLAPPRSSEYPEPEDRGSATLSALGAVEYVEDLIRPGRIVVVAAEEGTGKSYAITGELAIRVATAGGSFAGTWPILKQGPVLVLSEMHADDDFTREAAILDALDLSRDALSNCYYRLPLASAAGDAPALQVPEWRTWITQWLREREALLVVFDTATGAAQVDPWGGDIQGVYRGLRLMLEDYPELAIVLIVHLKKPQGRGERRISDVLGEWGRWCDVLLLLEREGEARVKLTARKRVRHERRIVATKAGGLLIDPQDMTEASGPKVAPEQVIAAVKAEPGLSIKALAERLGVARGTARTYIDKVPGIVLIPGIRGSLTCHLSDGVNQGIDMSLPRGGETDVSPVNPLIYKGGD